MAENRSVTPQERMAAFIRETRQNMHMLSQKSTAQEFSTLSFEFPKSRYLACVYVQCTVDVTLTHASTTEFPIEPYQFARAIRRLSLDLNTGFKPFVLTGGEAMLYDYIGTNVNMISPAGNAWNNIPEKLTASSSGAKNTCTFTLKLPLTLSGRDLAGLVLLQNDATTVTLNIDVGNGADILTSAGLTAVINTFTANVMLETFSIPANPIARPSLSILKLVNALNNNIPASGQNIVKMPTGTTYRKILMAFKDADGNPADDDFISSNIELVFNQADVNYQVSPAMLKAINEMDLNIQLPQGVYCFDFSRAGFLSNYGGVRDLVNTAQLTEFWIRFNTSAAGSVDVISEVITQIVG